MNTCKLTVVIPTYNCLSTLPKAVETVRRQGQAVEILVVDDGSEDGTQAWLQAQADLRVIRTERVGVSVARNLAIEQACGELIAFLDADDYWHPEKLMHQLALHDANPQLVMSFTDYRFLIDDQPSALRCFCFWPGFTRRLSACGDPQSQVFPDFLSAVYRENMIGTSTVIARRDALLAVGGLDPQFRSASDWDLWLKLARQGPVGVVNQPLCDYTFGRVGAISGNHERRAAAMKQILDRHAASVRMQPLTLLAGYQRWFSATADCYRARRAFGGAVLRELMGFCLKPDWPRLKVISGDTLRWLSLRS
ncbi:glycosyltransferase family 2 protein [Photobacterium sp. TY1-4]|uniref:glycosyltransferase family 2 protein n=1 Tax=Photobacterium sp. TY1-4 TaxID=2899122 RepID=UPI0021BE6440|nr:glycosyltransferase family 2 protein [Photobacterium sp. TY1-4]UXI00233.1 glycosyltransferase [Photobacterium sp. TY1-4]